MHGETIKFDTVCVWLQHSGMLETLLGWRTKINGIVFPMRHSIQCHAVWWQKYQSFRRISVLTNIRTLRD